MLLKLPFIICLATMVLKGAVCGPLNDVLYESNGQSLKLSEIKLGKRQEIRVQESTAKCSSDNKGLLRIVDLHLEFCDGKSWVRLSDEMVAQNSREKAGIDCQDIKTRGLSQGDGLYWLDPDAGSHSNAFLAYCDMTSYNGGWTMCYTTDDKVKPKTEVTYNTQFTYGRDGYRTNCNNIPFTEIMLVDHVTGAKCYFKREATNHDLPITAAANYGNAASTYGLWHGVGASNAYHYQLLICDHSFFSGFFVSGYTSNCYKRCNSWCGDKASPYFRTASTDAGYKGVAFNTNGHYPNVRSNRLVSVGLRYKRDEL
ncbi:calcium ion binding [Desmophyllum pertusum]|uniref:Calcium ion binding n=1 Tax=Desmophyllum pertusum TaxID=174260 RepID=A0A9X0D4K7_9CNID|nr:calcium ion binding [Desmophyllum pertusum]